jgi:GntR family transcriptional regulator, transcriptional repressor for pyruvate dehydrogenase complex
VAVVSDPAVRRPTTARSTPRLVRGASAQVAEQIQHHIHHEGLGPGDFLGREDDLATEFGVSRPTLREALKLLASGNLIRANKGPGGGIFVERTAEQGMSRSLSDAIAMMLETGAVTIEELLDARELLEVPLAGRAALQASEEQIELLREGVAAWAAVDREDVDGLAAADGRIHELVADAADNAVVKALSGWVLEVLQPRLADDIGEAIVHSAVAEQHEALLAAIEKGDAARAERAMKDHLRYLRDILGIVRERGE